MHRFGVRHLIVSRNGELNELVSARDVLRMFAARPSAHQPELKVSRMT